MEQLLVTTFEASFEELEPRFKALERHLLRSVVRTESERREVRRRIAEALFTESFGRNCPWPIFGRTLRRIQRLGYTDVERRYHVASLYVQWCREHPEHDARKARRLLDDAERRIRSLPRGNTRREELLARLSELRTRTGERSGSSSAGD
jgi:hypothetical protein